MVCSPHLYNTDATSSDQPLTSKNDENKLDEDGIDASSDVEDLDDMRHGKQDYFILQLLFRNPCKFAHIAILYICSTIILGNAVKMLGKQLQEKIKASIIFKTEYFAHVNSAVIISSVYIIKLHS